MLLKFQAENRFLNKRFERIDKQLHEQRESIGETDENVSNLLNQLENLKKINDFQALQNKIN